MRGGDRYDEKEHELNRRCNNRLVLSEPSPPFSLVYPSNNDIITSYTGSPSMPERTIASRDGIA
jgi:hypothetical protein